MDMGRRVIVGKDLIQIIPQPQIQSELQSYTKLTAGSHWFHLRWAFLWIFGLKSPFKYFIWLSTIGPLYTFHCHKWPCTKFSLESSSVWGMIGIVRSDDILVKPLGYQLVGWEFAPITAILTLLGPWANPQTVFALSAIPWLILCCGLSYRISKEMVLKCWTLGCGWNDQYQTLLMVYFELANEIFSVDKNFPGPWQWSTF